MAKTRKEDGGGYDAMEVRSCSRVRLIAYTRPGKQTDALTRESGALKKIEDDDAPPRKK